MNYKPRILDKVLKERLESIGAVLITGPKWCGKTTTAKKIANSFLNMQDPINKKQYIALANLNPFELLKGETPRLIDEWQIAPVLWDAVRQEVDNRSLFNQFILTGSSVPREMSEHNHTGTGRISSLLMRTMSLYESGESNGEISLAELFNNPEYSKTAKSDISLNDISFLLCRGGWPLSTFYKNEIALRQPINYLDSLMNRDIIDVDGVKRNYVKTKELLHSYSRHISTSASNVSILRDINKDDNNPIMSMDSFVDYLEALKKLFVIEELEAWNPNYRSKTVARTSPKRHFVDPSLACASMNLNPNDLINDIKTYGLLFESMVIRDLRIYADCLSGKVYHYLDNTGLEVDAIIRLNNGKWGAVEVKLGSKEFDKAIKNFSRLLDRIDVNSMNKPSFLMIITATEYAYKTKEGIWIVPIGTLKP